LDRFEQYDIGHPSRYASPLRIDRSGYSVIRFPHVECLSTPPSFPPLFPVTAPFFPPPSQQSPQTPFFSPAASTDILFDRLLPCPTHTFRTREALAPPCSHMFAQTYAFYRTASCIPQRPPPPPRFVPPVSQRVAALLSILLRESSIVNFASANYT